MLQSGNEDLLRLKSVFEAAPCGIGVFEIGTREPLYLNEAYYKIVGYTPQEYSEIVSNKDSMLLFPIDKETNRHVETQYHDDGSLSGARYRILRKTGEVLWIELTMVNTVVDGTECALCFFENITAEKENFEQMRLVADSIGSSISVMRIKNGKEQLLYANDTFFELIGVDRKQYMQNTDMYNNLFASENDRIRTRDAVKKSLKTGEPQSLTYKFLRPGHESMWMERRLTSVAQDEAGCFILVSVATDITDKKQNEIALELEQRRYQLVIEEMNAAVFEWDLRTGEFYCSENYREYAMSTVTPKLLLANKGPADMIHPDDIPVMHKFFADTKSGAPRAETTLRLLLKSGGYRWCRMVGLFYRDSDGRPVRTLGIIIDINEEKEKSFMLDSLLNELPGGVAVFKLGKKIECQYFNDGYAKLSQHTREEMFEIMRGDDALDKLIAQADLPRFGDGLRASTAAGESINMTFRMLTKSGGFSWIHMYGSKLRDENESPVYYCVFTYPPEETSMYQGLVDQSTTGVFVAEQKTRRVLYCNDKMREIYHVKPGVRIAGRLVLDMIPQSEILLSREELESLQLDVYSEFHRQHGEYYLGIRAKATVWNDTDCYILYVSDETQEHEKRMQQEELLNLVPMGIGIFKIYGGALHQVYMNDSYYRMVGDKRENRGEKEKADFLSLVNSEDAEAINSAVLRCEGGSDEETIDHRILCGDGEYRWFRMAISVVKREKGRVTVHCGYANINDAITAQEALKKANEEVQKQYSQEMNQRKMLEKDSMVAVQFNVTKDKLVSYRVNQGLVKEFERGSLGSLIRPDIESNIPTEKERRIAADFFSVPRAKERFKNGIKEFTAEYRRRLNDGRLYWLNATCRLALDEESGDLMSFTYLRDIDIERKKELAAESVIDEETDFVMLLNTVSNTAMLLRLRGTYNHRVWKLFAEFPFAVVSEAESIDVVHPEDRRKVYAFMHRDILVESLKSEPVVTLNYRHSYPDNTERIKKLRAFYLDETHEDIVIARRDITDIHEEEKARQLALQQALDEAKSASRAKSDFLSRMSHDLRTPMNVIIGLTSMAMDRPNNSPDMVETLSNITSSAKYLLSLINDCLDLEKITGGKIELHIAPYTYPEFADSVRAVIGPLCRQKQITFDMTGDTAGCPAFLADRVRLEQIFYNLLSNAVKFTPDGGRIELCVNSRYAGGEYCGLECFVRDNGVGMSEEFQKHMYEAFTQEANSITPDYQGSGLGLTIVKQLVDLIGAAISVKSEMHRGTEFTVRFRFPAVLGKTVPKVVSSASVDGVLSGRRVLLAEDHPLNSMIASKLMGKKNMLVIKAENGRQAVEKFEEAAAGYYDAILMDIRMPVMNGLEAARAIRALDRPDAAAVPIIAMTANPFDADVDESMKAGMNAHLSKPIEPQKLYDTLARFISRPKVTVSIETGGR